LMATHKNKASDLHLSTRNPPIMRVNGDMLPLDMPALDAEEVKRMLFSIMTDQQRSDYEQELELDFSISFASDMRFRVNTFNTIYGAAAVFRTIPTKILSLDTLGAPEVLKRLCHLHKGMILVTGPTGSGKSTTLAAMVDYINQNFNKHILTVEDPVEFIHAPRRSLINQREVGGSTKSFAKALKSALREDPDVILVGEMRDLETIQLADIDGLRLATQFKAIEQVRNVPIVMLVDEDEQHLMLKGLELGVNDYLLTPVDFNEMFARLKTQIRRKKYQETLKSNYQESVSMAVTDGLTKLYNRHYLDTHLKNLVRQAAEQSRALSLVIMDMDHFKSVNDTYGHSSGDEVLKTLAEVIVKTIRSADLAARYGGEEFVVLMPETDAVRCYEAAERLRKGVENTPFIIPHPESPIRKTTSIGCATMQPNDTPETLLKRADVALYEAKNTGRNKVLPLATAAFELSPSRQNAREELSYTTIASNDAGMKLAVPGASGPAPAPVPNAPSAAAPAVAPPAEKDDFPFVVRFKDSQ
jgi:diguanylate cyclase (GGDEF)-like protein